MVCAVLSRRQGKKAARRDAGLGTFFWNSDRSSHAYPTLESFLSDVTDILRTEVGELVQLGARYIQIDAPHYPLLLDEGYRTFYESLGWSASRWLQIGVELDNAVIDAGQGAVFVSKAAHDDVLHALHDALATRCRDANRRSLQPILEYAEIV